MSGLQIGAVLALCLILPTVCGMSQHCASSMGSIDHLCTFVAGGMVGLAQAIVRLKRRSSTGRHKILGEGDGK